MKFMDLSHLTDVFLKQLNEPFDNQLQLQFHQSVTSETPESISTDGIELRDVYAIEIDESLPILQLEFNDYIAYSVRNESYAANGDDQFEGVSFRIYQESAYLRFIEDSTCANDVYPGPYVHYGIVCMNHVIDIVAVNEPIVTEISQ